MTKATPELFYAVREAGPATKDQVVLWFKNRRARAKQQPAKAGSERSGVPDDDRESICLQLREPSLQEADVLVASENEEREDHQTNSNFRCVQSSLLDHFSSFLQM